MGVGRLGRLLSNPASSKSSAEPVKLKGKAPATSPEDSEMGRRRPLLGVDTTSLPATGPGRSYGATSGHINGAPFAKSHSPEAYRSGHYLFNVPEELDIDDDEALDELLEAEGLYVGSYRRLVQTYAVVPFTALLVWLIAAFLPPLIWHTDKPPASHAPYFPTPLPELLLSISLFALSHLLSPSLFAFSGTLLRAPASANALATALHVLLRNALRTAALPLLALSVPGGATTFRAPAFRAAWWLALGWSFAEVAAGVAQGLEILALYRDVLVPRGRAREILAAVAGAKGGGSASVSPPRGADERLRESLSRGEDGGASGASPVRTRQAQLPAWGRTPSDVEIQLEVDRDFDELVAVKAREELEELYGFPAIRLPVFVSCLLRVASILLSLGFTLLLSAAYLASPLASPAVAEKTITSAMIPPSRTDGTFWGTFAVVCAINWGLSLLHTPVFLPRVGVHVVAYLGFLVGLGTLFAGLGMWDALA
ncbi:hypothetical protein BC834DRAFT_887737 [Gloeopeniophorella convolvens]|nr:hypothetical protein BC834DRAFT_887737 [Gloeopeniophorella convolvens]